MGLKHACIFLFVFLLLIRISLAKDFSVGVSPPLIDLGEVNSDSSKPISFFIVTSSDETLLVYLEPVQALIDFFSIPSYSSYIYNYSEESTVAWVQTFSNPVELKPGDSTFGGSIKGQREINFLLNIPKNAEPGYHLVKILPKPALPSSSIGQVGIQIAAITPVVVLFKVPGQALRQGKILDITTGRQVGNNLELQTHFLNTGTVTISAHAKEIKVYDTNGSLIASLSSDIKKVRPNEKQILTATLPLNGLREGEYYVSASVDFTTGSVQKNSTIRIYPKAVLAPPEAPKPFVIPLWVFMLVAFLIISVIIYRFTHED